MRSAGEKQLACEARAISQALFSCVPPARLIDQYIVAHRFCCLPTENDPDMQRLIECSLDLEAIEIATRKNKTVLTKKMQLLIHLAELDSHYQDFFINYQSAFFRGSAALVFHSLRTAYKFAKGRLLVWRYALV